MEESEYLLVKRKVMELARVDLGSYKSRQVQRRLGTLLARSGYPTWQAYFGHLQQDRQALQAFKDYLTINVTEFFRDPQKWQYLEQNVLPALLRERRRLRVWSAGCSHGAEPYTLAMLLDQLTGGGTRHYILATDIDQAILAKAEQGGPYPPSEVKAVTPTRLRRYFVAQGDTFSVRPDLRDRVTFRPHNLLLDPFEGDFDLIVCRNVVIYFVEETKRALYQRFAQALRPGGVLFVGGTEIVPAMPALPLGNADRLHPFAISFYRRRE
jgi:chemotaxis protein methyltransferase CheR